VFRFDPQDNFLPDLCAKIVNSHSYAVLRCVVVVVVWSVWSVFVCVWVGGGGGGVSTLSSHQAIVDAGTAEEALKRASL
jgi:hypothetical protein